MWDYWVKALDWLKDETNREILKVLGGGFAAITLAVWAIYKHLPSKSETTKHDPKNLEKADQKHQELLATISGKNGVPIAALRAAMVKITDQHVPDSDPEKALQKWADDFIFFSQPITGWEGFKP